MITINRSLTSESRSNNFSSVDKETLKKCSSHHIIDVTNGLNFFRKKLASAGLYHDKDKISGIDLFYHDFKGGFKDKKWLENHYSVSRHHLNKDFGVPDDVNLLDVLEMVSDCVMAGLSRDGNVHPVKLSDSILRKALENTVKLLMSQIIVED